MLSPDYQDESSDPSVMASKPSIGAQAPGMDEEDTESWLRRNSTWKVRKVRRESKKSIDHGAHSRASSQDRDSHRIKGRRRADTGPGTGTDGSGFIVPGSPGLGVSAARGEGQGELDVEHAGEQTGLLSEGKEREAKKERLAKFALNGAFFLNVPLQASSMLLRGCSRTRKGKDWLAFGKVFRKSAHR